MKRMASTRVSIQIHLPLVSSQTSSSSRSLLIRMLMASYSDIDLSIELIDELIGMQS